MEQRLGRGDFERSSGVRDGSSGTRMWKVCEGYELRRPADSDEGDVAGYLLVPSYMNEPANFGMWRAYEPLKDTPDLFLKFARLHGSDDAVEAMVGWVRAYGVLGHGERPYQPGSPQQLRQFWDAVERAAGVLALYEAVLNNDESRAESICLREFPFVSAAGRLFEAFPDIPADAALGMVIDTTLEVVEKACDGDYLRYALERAADDVEYMVRNYCVPSLRVEDGSRDASGVTAGWNFKSLLGAMYLQMYWLMASGSELARCEYCGLLLSLARPNPEGRKRRSDRRFCGDACRQAHHRAKKES
jgi:hypothetical protein